MSVLADYYDDFDCYDIPEPIECPACGDMTLFPCGSESYGADRDGRRGIKVTNYVCSECGWEGFGE